MQDTKPEIVRKGNLLIASKLNLSRNESRVLELVFAQINPFEDVSFQKQYRVDVVDLVKIKKNNKVYMELEDIANGLTSKNIHLRQEDGSFEFLTITNMVKYDADEGAIFVELNNNLLTYLLKSPKQIESEKKQLELKEKKDRIDALKTEKAGWAYTSYQLKYHLILQSNHALRFYELLKQYESIGKRVLYVEEIKILLEIEERYSAYADFKRNVILLAQKELKSKTDICFDFEEIKKRRRVYAIRFTIYKNNRVEEGLNNKIKSESKVEKTSEFLEDNFDETIAELKKLRKPSDEEMTDQKALQLINRFGENYIKKCIALLKQEDKSTKNNFVGFVIKAIENNWLDDKILEIGRKEKKLEKIKEKKQDEERAKKEEEYVDNLYGKYWENQLELLLASVNIDAEVSNYLETKENLREYKELKIDLENRNIYSMNWSLFIGWLQEQNPQVKFLSKVEFKNRYYANKNLKPVDKVIVNNKSELSLFTQEELVGSKKDLLTKNSRKKATKIPLSDIQELANELNCSVDEVISKNGYSIEGNFAVKYDE
ncbi:MAG: replication initiation protein [Flavobacteriales bacterium]|nr:replication initiation protein [Flavobacteriales bacterium]MCL4856017.1 RepB family plasmid replication initiator protein [Flavobacteriales bacterium]